MRPLLRRRARASAWPARAARPPRGPLASSSLRQRCTAARADARRGRSRRRRRSARRASGVRITLGGHSPSGSGHTRSPSSATSYGVGAPGLEAADSARARSGGRRRGTSRAACPSDLDGARRVRLDPDGRLVLPDVAEERAQDERRHRGATLPCDRCVRSSPVHSPRPRAAPSLALAGCGGTAGADRPDTERDAAAGLHAQRRPCRHLPRRAARLRRGGGRRPRRSARPARRRTRSSCCRPGRDRRRPSSTSTTSAWRASAGADLVGVMALVQRPLAAVLAAARRPARRATSRAGASA